jgi:DNA gyrase/topoisomerase IV subunit A
MLTNQNNIKKIKKEVFEKIKKTPTLLMSLNENDKILKVEKVKDGDIL